MRRAAVTALKARRLVYGFRADLLLALLLAAWAEVETVWVEGLEVSSAPAAAVGLLLTVPLAWRRRAPTVVVALVFTGIVLAGSDEGVYAIASFAISLYSLGAYASRRRSAVALGAAAVAMGLEMTEGARTFGTWLENVVFVYIIGAGLWVAGQVVRSSRARASQLEALTVELEREREEKARLAAAEERTRIARELHDVVAHSLSVIVVQAGAAQSVDDRDGARARDALRSIDHAGREALGEMRRMLGLLRTAPDELQIGPQPSIAEASALVEKAGDGGLPVRLRVEGEPRPLPAGLDLAAYRVVQEALTNVIKHAHGAATSVVIRWAPSALELDVANDPPENGVSSVGSDGPGHGHVGMRERVALYGGQLRVGPRPEGGYRVHARLPLEESRP